MIIDLEWALRSEEVWVGIVVIITTNLLPVEGQTYNLFDNLWRVGVCFPGYLIGVDAEAMGKGSLVCIDFI